MRRTTLTCFVILLLAGCSSVNRGLTPAPPGNALYTEISHADAAMFEAFNAHDLAQPQRWFGRDLEFYHDTGGLLSYEQAMEGFSSNFAKNNGLRRELVGELEVYPIRGYGAIEIGSHRFCHVENGKDDCGVFKFVHVWRNEGGRWQVTRVVSYDHK
jgi:hypothetical protein